MALTKKYKPGQLVTIKNRVYRICKTNYICACVKCDAYNLCHYSDCGFVSICINTYLKLVKV